MSKLKGGNIYLQKPKTCWSQNKKANIWGQIHKKHFIEWILSYFTIHSITLAITWSNTGLSWIGLSKMSSGNSVCHFASASMWTHWDWMTHICVSKLATTGSDNGLLPGRRQAIIWTTAGILSIQNLGTNFSAILSEIHTFSFKKTDMKMPSVKWWPFCLGPNVSNWASFSW